MPPIVKPSMLGTTSIATCDHGLTHDASAAFSLFQNGERANVSKAAKYK